MWLLVNGFHAQAFVISTQRGYYLKSHCIQPLGKGEKVHLCLVHTLIHSQISCVSIVKKKSGRYNRNRLREFDHR